MNKLNIRGAEKMVEMYKGKKRIILISDVHTDISKNTCRKNTRSILITDFLEKLLLRNPQEQWDFYIEHMAGYDFFWIRNSEYYKWKLHWKKLKFIKRRIHNPTNQLLPLVLHHFASKGCFIKLKCKIRNTRFHFIDVRQEKFGSDCKINSLHWDDFHFIHFKYTHALNVVAGNTFLWPDGKTSAEYLAEEGMRIPKNYRVKDVIKDLRRDLYEFFKQFIKNLKNIIPCFSTKDKIYKQLHKSELKKEIINYYNKHINLTIEALVFLHDKMKKHIDYLVDNSIRYIILTVHGKNTNKLWKKTEKKVYGKKYNKLYKKLEKILDKNRSNLDDRKFDSLEEIYFSAQNLLVDLYFLGRMSRKFYNKSQNNVIVIAGAAHIQNYTNFLKSIGYKYKWQSKQTSKKCSVIPNILSH